MVFFISLQNKQLMFIIHNDVRTDGTNQELEDQETKQHPCSISYDNFFKGLSYDNSHGNIKRLQSTVVKAA